MLYRPVHTRDAGRTVSERYDMQSRQDFSKARRWVVKVGSSLLTANGRGLDHDLLAAPAATLAYPLLRALPPYPPVRNYFFYCFLFHGDLHIVARRVLKLCI